MFNELTHLRKGMFSGLPYLKTLYLRKNLIRSIEDSTFSSNPWLEHIGLPQNQLTVITPKTFQGCYDIYSINLNDNDLYLIEPRSFLYLEKLRTLYLVGNDLTTLDESILPHSMPKDNPWGDGRNVYMYGNPIECDTMCWVVEGIRDGWLEAELAPCRWYALECN